MPDGTQTTEIAHRTSDPAIAHQAAGFAAAPQSFNDLKEMAKYMAKGELMVGAAVRGNAGDCMAVIIQAGKFGMDPFSLSQKTYVVTAKDGTRKIAYEAQAVASFVFASRVIEGRLRYQYEGEGPTRQVTVRGRIKGDTEDCEITTPRVKDIKIKNSPLWTSDPDQQLAYYGARAWSRRHAPDILMGVYDVDEFSSNQADGGFVNITPDQPQDAAARLESRMAVKPEGKPEQERKPEPPLEITDADFVDNDTPVDEPQADFLGDAEEEAPAKPEADDQAPEAKAIKEPPSKLAGETEKAAIAYAECWSAWYRSLTKDERKKVGAKFDKQAEQASNISPTAQDTINDAMNSPAADEVMG